MSYAENAATVFITLAELAAAAPKNFQPRRNWLEKLPRAPRYLHNRLYDYGVPAGEVLAGLGEPHRGCFGSSAHPRMGDSAGLIKELT